MRKKEKFKSTGVVVLTQQDLSRPATSWLRTKNPPYVMLFANHILRFIVNVAFLLFIVQDIQNTHNNGFRQFFVVF
jgi:hypothetical protein